MKLNLLFVLFTVFGLVPKNAFSDNVPSKVFLSVSCQNKQPYLGLKADSADFIDIRLHERLSLRYTPPGEFAMLEIRQGGNQNFVGDVINVKKNPCAKPFLGTKYFLLATNIDSPFHIYYSRAGLCTLEASGEWVRTSAASLSISTEGGEHNTIGLNRTVYSDYEQCRRSYTL